MYRLNCSNGIVCGPINDILYFVIQNRLNKAIELEKANEIQNYIIIIGSMYLAFVKAVTFNVQKCWAHVCPMQRLMNNEHECNRQ